MEQEAFESLIRSLERSAAANPSLYRAKLTAWAALGYGYVATMLALLLAVVVAFGWWTVHGGRVVAAKLGFVVLALVWGVLRSMWVKLDPPAGRAVTRQDAPALFAMIDEVRQAARAPYVHTVLVTEEFNAAIVQHPRLGIFGWLKNYLILGLPLMQALTVREFKAVVAHELGHLSGAHGKFGAWIYRLRLGWARLHQALTAERHWGGFLFAPFFGWFAPRFAAYSFVQARQQEYEADRMSAQVTNAHTAASALLRVRLQSKYVREHYWRDIFKRVEHEPHPIAAPYAQMSRPLNEGHESSQAQRLLETSLKQKTGYDDTHPALADRLAALGCAAFTPPPMRRSAAAEFLGDLESTLAAEFDREWREQVAQWWQRRFEELGQARERLAALDAIVERPLTFDERWEQACLIEELGDEARAMEGYRQLTDENAQHAGARIAYGRLLLTRDDERGVEYLNQAAKFGPQAAQTACDLIVGYLRRHGRDAEAKPYIAQYHAASAVLDEAREERARVLTTDALLTHELDAEQVAAVVRQLAVFPELKIAYLARKQLRHFPESPLYVVGVAIKKPWWKFDAEAETDALVSRLAQQTEFPGEALIVPLSRKNRAFLKKFKSISSAVVYRHN